MKREYRRHLPHQIPEGVPIFITWNLKGAMPHAVIERLKHERMRLHRAPQRPGESPTDRAVRESTLLFARADDFLDNCGAGPRLLENPDAARIVETAILAGVSQRYTLWAWCIMANHVHVLLTPIVALATVMQHLKGGTSFELNRLTNERGRIVWQDESYDHWARDEEEML